MDCTLTNSPHELLLFPVIGFLFQQVETVALQVFVAVQLPSAEHVVVSGIAVSHEDAIMNEKKFAVPTATMIEKPEEYEQKIGVPQTSPKWPTRRP